MIGHIVTLIMAVKFMHPCKMPQNGWISHNIPQDF
jgi:hypothetical protein